MITLFRCLLLTGFLFLATERCDSGEPFTGNWHQAAGPNGTWHVDADNVPTRWSVSRNENILWRTPLPEGGQSSVVVWGDRLFVTTHKPWPADADPELLPAGSDVDAYCLNSHTGKILWKVRLPGSREMKYAGIFSDSTSPTPVTDGKHVWFFNASGMMGCWDFEGKEFWTRTWQPRMRHHSRQFEPMLFGDSILNVEVLDKDAAKLTAMHKPLPGGVDPKRVWTYLHGIDKRTGKVRWVAEAGTAIHNTPVFGRLANGRPAVFHGRGGGHKPPETPYGPGLTSLAPGEEGKTIWNLAIDGGSSYYTSPWNDKYACWFHGDRHYVIDASSGKLLRKQPLEQNVVLTEFNEATQRYHTRTNVSVKVHKGKGNGTPNTNQANILVGDWHYFLAHEAYLIGRVHVETGRVEYLQVPVQVIRKPGEKDRMLWDKALVNDTRNSRGVDIGIVDKRSKGSGWGHVSAAGPTAVGSKIFFPTMVGIIYVIDANAGLLDENALIAINDLGPAGKTWSLTSISYANGRIYHRGMKDVVCIGK